MVLISLVSRQSPPTLPPAVRQALIKKIDPRTVLKTEQHLNVRLPTIVLPRKIQTYDLRMEVFKNGKPLENSILHYGKKRGITDATGVSNYIDRILPGTITIKITLSNIYEIRGRGLSVTKLKEEGDLKGVSAKSVWKGMEMVSDIMATLRLEGVGKVTYYIDPSRVKIYTEDWGFRDTPPTMTLKYDEDWSG